MNKMSNKQLQHDNRHGAKQSGDHQHLGADREVDDPWDNDFGPDRSERRMTQRIRRSQWIGVGGPNRTTGTSLKRRTRFSNDDLRLGHEDEARTRLGRSNVTGSEEELQHDKEGGLIKTYSRISQDLRSCWRKRWWRRSCHPWRMTSDLKQTEQPADSGGSWRI